MAEISSPPIEATSVVMPQIVRFGEVEFASKEWFGERGGATLERE